MAFLHFSSLSLLIHLLLFSEEKKVVKESKNEEMSTNFSHSQSFSRIRIIKIYYPGFYNKSLFLNKEFEMIFFPGSGQWSLVTHSEAVINATVTSRMPVTPSWQ